MWSCGGHVGLGAEHPRVSAFFWMSKWGWVGCRVFLKLSQTRDALRSALPEDQERRIRERVHKQMLVLLGGKKKKKGKREKKISFVLS